MKVGGFRTWRAFDREGRFLGMIEALDGHEFEVAQAIYLTPAVRLEPEPTIDEAGLD